MKTNMNGLLYRTILHELGHTIGLDHTNEQGVMSAYLSNYSTLQYDDIEGFNYLVDETLRRQSIGYTSPFSAQQSSNSLIGNCGSAFAAGELRGSGGFIWSFLFGLTSLGIIRLLNRLGRRKKLPN
jgi:hypothetical protein